MARTEDTRASTASAHTTKTSRSQISGRPRLNKITVLNAIRALGDIRGSTVLSILRKLQRRSEWENITRVQVEKAIARLVDDGQVKQYGTGSTRRVMCLSAAKVHPGKTTKASAVAAKSGGKKAKPPTKSKANVPRAAGFKAPGVQTKTTKASTVAAKSGGKKAKTPIKSKANVPRAAGLNKATGVQTKTTKASAVAAKSGGKKAKNPIKSKANVPLAAGLNKATGVQTKVTKPSAVAAKSGEKKAKTSTKSKANVPPMASRGVGLAPKESASKHRPQTPVKVEGNFVDEGNDAGMEDAELMALSGPSRGDNAKTAEPEMVEVAGDMQDVFNTTFVLQSLFGC